MTGLVSRVQDIYQACRGWTIACYQHITDNDFTVRLVEMDVLKYNSSDDVGEF